MTRSRCQSESSLECNNDHKSATLSISDLEKSGHQMQRFKFALSFFASCLAAITISFVPSFVRSSPAGTSSKRLGPTAYLEGIRGSAAFIVFIHHTIIDWYPALSWGYGTSSTRYPSYIIQLPILRIIYSGRAMVAVFFVISGFVLSYKPLKLMRSGRHFALLDCLASSTFRRGIRLLLPITFTTFMSLLMTRQHWYIQDPLGQNIIPDILPDFSSQLFQWWSHLLVVTNPFICVDGIHLYAPPYDGHLWTIPIEFHGSFIIFLTCLCISRLAGPVRAALLAAMVIYTMWWVRWDLFLFLSGALLCDIQLACHLNTETAGYMPISATVAPISYTRAIILILASYIPKLGRTTRTILSRTLVSMLFFIALYILSFPDLGADITPGYERLVESTPAFYDTFDIDNRLAYKQRFWLAIGAVLLVFSINFSTLLQAVFSCDFPQYLGRISYAMYIVHGPILYTLGMRMFIPAYEGLLAGSPEEYKGLMEPKPKGLYPHPGPDTTPYLISCTIAIMVDTLVVFWVADWVWREVDARSVAFARSVARLCWVDDETVE